jgi:hypothetical protein
MQNQNKQIDEMVFNLIMATSPLGVKDLTKQFDYNAVAKDLYELYGWRKQSEWISVDERMPENDWGKHWKERKYYLVITAPSGLMSVATYGSKDFGWWVDRHSCVLDEKNYNRVTHWMPLPQAPKMKGGAG